MSKQNLFLNNHFLHSYYYVVQNLKRRKVREQGWSNTESCGGSIALIFWNAEAKFHKKTWYFALLQLLATEFERKKSLAHFLYFYYFFFVKYGKRVIQINSTTFKTLLCTTMSKNKLNNFKPLKIYKMLLSGLNLFSIANEVSDL